MNNIVLQDAAFDSLTVAWNPLQVNGASSNTMYELQMCEFSLDDTQVESKLAQAQWKSLSNSLSNTAVKKKNLIPNQKYVFRVRGRLDGKEWSDFSEPSPAFSVPDANKTKMMDPPVLSINDEESVTITWSPVEGVEGYKIRFRGEFMHSLSWIV
jgi:hypothetical protein